MSELEKNMINDEELEKVSGGIGVVGRLTYDQCTMLLKEAGDLAYARSETAGGGHHWSPLHDHISGAEHSSDETLRFQYVELAIKDMGAGPANIACCALSQGEYDSIRSTLDIIYRYLKPSNPRILA